MPDSPQSVKSRREQYSEATRSALIDSATRLMAERGYTGTALADVAADASVTRGAVYHHFADKQALYEAVLERFETNVTQAVAAAALQGSGPWDGTLRALTVFLDQCCDPVYGRIVWREGPTALGWQRWRECEYQYSYGLIEQFTRTLIDSGEIRPVPVVTTSRLIFAMLGETGLTLAEADGDHKAAVRAESEQVLREILEALRVKPRAE